MRANASMDDRPLRIRFKKAFQDLALFPLLTPEQIGEFRVDFGTDTSIALAEYAREKLAQL